jgi:hypothetical protein
MNFIGLSFGEKVPKLLEEGYQKLLDNPAGFCG